MSEQVISHYRLVRQLGAGGMGEVHLAEDLNLGRPVALKFIASKLATDPESRQRFLIEGKAAAALNHPNVCTVHEVGQTEDGRLFIAMEFLEGQTLKDRLAQGPLEITRVVDIGLQITEALVAAHAKGILHRDLKPANINLDARGQVKVLDFGLAKRLPTEAGPESATTQLATEPGRVLGTPDYISPEQALGREVDPRADLFSLGAVLYHLVTGRPPFGGRTLAEQLERIVHRQPEALARFNYEVPSGLEKLILKCLEKDPEHRYQSARELAVDLKALKRETERVDAQPAVERPSRETPPEVVTLAYVEFGAAAEVRRQKGPAEAADLINQQQKLVHDHLAGFPSAQEVEVAGETVLLTFPKPSSAVQFALGLLCDPSLRSTGRVGVHLGEVLNADADEARERYGIHRELCAQLLELAQPGRILLSRAVFDSARQVLKAEDLPGMGALSWVNHGPYLLKGIEAPVEVCEVGRAGPKAYEPPRTTEKAQRQVRPDEEPVLGWRPAVGLDVPNTQWVLEEKLGEGGFGEVWRARHPKLREDRVFKFCFRADRVRSLKREVTLFRLLKERWGEHANIVRLYEVYFEQPPYYLEEEYVPGKDLRTWCEAQGGVDKVPLETRLEIVAQAADALQAAHDAGIIHRDVKPGNILVSGQGPVVSNQWSVISDQKGADHRPPVTDHWPLAVKLTDFGIGQLVSAEALAGVTKSGFTQTLLGSSTTQTGTMLYQAPELLAGSPATTRSDIYSLGVVLYQLVVGDFRRPVTADWPEQVNDPLLREDLKQCFAWDTQQRFSSAGQLAERLRGLPARREAAARQQAVEAERARRHRWLVAAAGAMAVLLALALALGYGMRRAQVERDRARRLAYAADINLAQQALAVNKIGRAIELLDRHRPQAGEPDLRGWEWRYLWQQCRSDALFTLCQKSNPIGSLAVSPDGKWLAVAEIGEGGASIWDVDKRKDHGRLPGRQEFPPVAFSPTEPVLAYEFITNSPAAKEQSMIRLWDFVRQRVLDEFPVAYGCQGLAFSSDGRRLAFYCLPEASLGQGHIVVRSVPERREVVSYSGPLTFTSTAFAVDRDLTVAVFASTNCTTLEVIDLGTGKQRWWTNATDESFQALALSPDGRTLATSGGTTESFVRLWDVASGREIGLLEGHLGYVICLAFWPDGKRLASGSADQTIRVWDVERRRTLATLRGHRNEVQRLALLPGHGRLVSGCKDGSVCFWDTGKVQSVRTAKCLEAQDLLSFQIIDDGLALLTLDVNGRVARRRWMTIHEAEVLTDLGANREWPSLLPGPQRPVAELSPDCRWAAVGSTNGAIDLWNVPQRSRVRRFTPPASNVVWIEFEQQSKKLLSITREGSEYSVRTWDLHSGVESRLCGISPDFLGYPRRPLGLLSPDGRSFLALRSGGAYTLVHIASRRETVGRLRKESTVVEFNAASFSPDGRFFATSDLFVVRMWETATQREVGNFGGFMTGIHSVGFSPDGKRLAAGSDAKEAVKLWDLESRQELITLEGKGGKFYPIHFSRDGSVLASVSSSGVLHLWRAPSWAEIEAAEKDKARSP